MYHMILNKKIINNILFIEIFLFIYHYQFYIYTKINHSLQFQLS
jgi:hypothetical protein